MRRFLEATEIPENAVLLDARPAAQYEAGHLPGARNVDLSGQKFPVSSEADLEYLHHVLANVAGLLGLEHGQPAVVYDNGPETRAARAAWALEYAGLEIALLRGGVGAWTDAGLALETTLPEWAPSSFELRARPELLATADEIAGRLGDPALRIVDARSTDEFSGARLGPGNPRGGRVPGAVHLEWSRVMDERGYLRSEELEALLAGIPRDAEVVVYCQSGARSAAVYHAMRSLGIRARNYVGSAGEWTSRQELPVESGPGVEL